MKISTWKTLKLRAIRDKHLHEQAEAGDALPQYNLGDALPQNNLGDMYHDGEGVPQDYAEAAKWYRLAADQGDAEAQNNLGTIYDYGGGVPQDYVVAHMWYNIASANGHEFGGTNRDKIAKKMTPEEIGKSQLMGVLKFMEITGETE